MTLVPKHNVEWQYIDIDFKDLTQADLDALFEALAPPDDVIAQQSIAMETEPDSLEKRFKHWGWGTDLVHGSLTTIGRYWDQTCIEDDVRFMPIIAPYIIAQSYAVFDVSRDTERNDFWDDYEGWFFDGTTVERAKVTKIIDWARVA